MAKVTDKRFEVTVTFNRQELNELSDILALAGFFVEDLNNETVEGRQAMLMRWHALLVECHK